MPATNATSGRTFSSLRRVKTYLHSTMTQLRANHVLILSAHSDKTDVLSLIYVANDFVSAHETRLSFLASSNIVLVNNFSKLHLIWRLCDSTDKLCGMCKCWEFWLLTVVINSY